MKKLTVNLIGIAVICTAFLSKGGVAQALAPTEIIPSMYPTRYIDAVTFDRRVVMSSFGQQSSSMPPPAHSFPSSIPGVLYTDNLTGTSVTPSMAIAANTSNVLHVANGVLNIYSRDLTAQRTSIQLNDVFNAVIGPVRAFVDNTTNRFIIVAQNKPLAGQDVIYYIATSRTNDPNGVWYIFHFLANMQSRIECVIQGNCKQGFPHHGADDFVININANISTIEGRDLGANMYIISKKGIFNSANTNLVVFQPGKGDSNPAMKHVAPSLVTPGVAGTYSNIPMLEAVPSTNTLRLVTLQNTNTIDTINPNLIISGFGYSVNQINETVPVGQPGLAAPPLTQEATNFAGHTVVFKDAVGRLTLTGAISVGNLIADANNVRTYRMSLIEADAAPLVASGIQEVNIALPGGNSTFAPTVAVDPSGRTYVGYSFVNGQSKVSPTYLSSAISKITSQFSRVSSAYNLALGTFPAYCGSSCTEIEIGKYMGMTLASDGKDVYTVNEVITANDFRVVAWASALSRVKATL